MMRRFLILFAVMLVVLLLSAFFQNAGEESAVSFSEAITNINERLGFFLFVIIGGAAFTAFVLFVFQKALDKFKDD